MYVKININIAHFKKRWNRGYSLILFGKTFKAALNYNTADQLFYVLLDAHFYQFESLKRQEIIGGILIFRELQ